MRRTGKAAGFTLVELLTVVAIVALLIGILVPAVARARVIAKRAAVMAEHHSVGIGLDMFKNDFGYYPSSLPQDNVGQDAPIDRNGILARNNSPEIQGSHRLAFALMGRDRQGCPAASGTSLVGLPNAKSDRGPDSITGFYYTSNGALAGDWLDTPAWGTPALKTSRHGPYVDISNLVALKDDANTGKLYTWLFADVFERSKEAITAYTTRSLILYYAANERGTGIGATTAQDKMIYYYEDNVKIAQGFGVKTTNETEERNAFWEFIEDKNAAIGTGATAFLRPRNPDTYLLISPGEDGSYGTDDDIINGQAAKQ